ncbi:hypothetical protein L228DRAFT_244852 [Xylona heveae TC161]|uniref:Uncharacterized protein n=1 Tax=Xylona heveae (strain CBS 132557 / TC161) TaxID=1328760 RepID=A0A165HVV9_XYLHT|nr:hypothetical protein L228DRAFT_244852 [Xylona heveae TC161]KZF23993.1 hypothetical protein L228DRAFT_244852 [Xylona heveae TC161]
MAPIDPRVNFRTSYNQDEIIATMTAYYQFLSRLPYVDPSDIMYPPPGGWPEINQETLGYLGRTDTVIELLRHLPYINTDNHDFLVSLDVHAADYRGKWFKSSVAKKVGSFATPVGATFPPNVIGLTNGKNTGVYLMLDTVDGTITPYEIMGYTYDPTYPPGDPRSWRDQCHDETLRLSDILDRWKQKFATLEWMASPLNGWPYIWWGDDRRQSEETRQREEMREIFRAHGWPNSFRRDECKQALIKWEEERHRRYREAQNGA